MDPRIRPTLSQRVSQVGLRQDTAYARFRQWITLHTITAPGGTRYCTVEALARQHAQGVVHFSKMVTLPSRSDQQGPQRPQGLFAISATSYDAFNYARVVLTVVADLSDIVQDQL